MLLIYSHVSNCFALSLFLLTQRFHGENANHILMHRSVFLYSYCPRLCTVQPHASSLDIQLQQADTTNGGFVCSLFCLRPLHPQHTVQPSLPMWSWGQPKLLLVMNPVGSFGLMHQQRNKPPILSCGPPQLLSAYLMRFSTRAEKACSFPRAYKEKRTFPDSQRDIKYTHYWCVHFWILISTPHSCGLAILP